MDVHKALLSLSAAVAAGIALAGLLWSTHDGRPTSDTPSGAPAPGKASSLSADKPSPTATGQNTTAPPTPSVTGQSSTDNGSPAPAGPELAADRRELIETNRDRLLSTQAELRARIAELRADEGAVPISDQELLR